jgi:hypothetical protein
MWTLIIENKLRKSKMTVNASHNENTGICLDKSELAIFISIIIPILHTAYSTLGWLKCPQTAPYCPGVSVCQILAFLSRYSARSLLLFAHCVKPSTMEATSLADLLTKRD